ncbi:MAG: protein phosphatase CheZ [Vibrionaceae bacterium]
MITLSQAQNLVHLLENGEQEKAEQLFLQLIEQTKQGLSIQEGKVELQSKDCSENAVSAQLTTTLTSAKLPEVEERLDFILEKTQRAADKSIDAIEVTQLIVDDLHSALSRLRTNWRSFAQIDALHTDELAVSVDAIFDKMDFQCKSLRSQLNQILEAQEFQDITGQVIVQVINVLQQIQTQFISIVDLHEIHREPEQKSVALDLTIAEGPIVTQSQKQEKSVLKDQNEVDDLLSSLGL